MTKEFKSKFWLVVGAVVITVVFLGFLALLKASSRRSSDSILEQLVNGGDITTYLVIFVAMIVACVAMLRKQLQMIIVNDEGIQAIHFASENSWISWSQVEVSVITNSLIHLHTNWDEHVSIRLWSIPRSDREELVALCKKYLGKDRDV